MTLNDYLIKIYKSAAIFTHKKQKIQLVLHYKHKTMDDNFSPKVKDVIAYSKEEALRLGHDFIGTEHLMLGLLRKGEGKAIEILNSLNLNLNHLRNKIEVLSPANPSTDFANKKKSLH